jgi:MFS family permease
MTALDPRDADVADASALPAAAEPDETVLSRSYRALSVGIVSVVLLIAFEATAVGTAMPVAARELDGVGLYAFAFSGYFTTSLLGMVAAGQWSDRRGPLGALTTGIAAFAAGLLLSGTAGGMWLFILGRAVQGLGGGLVIVALYVVVGRAYPERLRPAIMAAFAASWVVPSVVGPLASGAVTEHLGWRWVFIGIPVLVVFPLALARPPPSTVTASAWRWVSPWVPDCSSTPPRTCAGSRCCPARRARRCSCPPSSACSRAARTGRPADCPPSCCCAGSRPGPSSPRSPSSR